MISVKPSHLSMAREPLYFVLDGAREPSGTAAMLSSAVQSGSLYDGQAAEEMGSFGPHLVALPDDPAGRERWVRTIWGRNLGVFLTCSLPFEAVRRHLRRFLLVMLEGGRKVYFRYYDPRVLRRFLPTCTPDEWAQFFGPIAAYYTESDGSTHLLEFEKGSGARSEDQLPCLSADGEFG